MSKVLEKLSVHEIHDLLAEVTLKYNQILLHGGSKEEFNQLAECLKIIQEEILKRRKETNT